MKNFMRRINYSMNQFKSEQLENKAMISLQYCSTLSLKYFKKILLKDISFIDDLLVIYLGNNKYNYVLPLDDNMIFDIRLWVFFLRNNPKNFRYALFPGIQKGRFENYSVNINRTYKKIEQKSGWDKLSSQKIRTMALKDALKYTKTPIETFTIIANSYNYEESFKLLMKELEIDCMEKRKEIIKQIFKRRTL